ncbi:MAG: cyclic pyranopterin monophosphate synthase MoaC [Chitinivibrionales bacterium]|nr:cyclic pyranopterin monophosphate synthase MoaC [Chitinivibrionales bacterium]
MEFSHFDKSGRVTMVDVSGKGIVKRTAVASGKIFCNPETIEKIRRSLIKKGDPLACARIAGIMAAKKTGDLIPLCHPLPVDQVSIDCSLHDNAVSILATVITTAKTGVEMEALTAVSVAALTVYDMCKAVDKNMTISDITLIKKTKEPAP